MNDSVRTPRTVGISPLGLIVLALAMLVVGAIVGGVVVGVRMPGSSAPDSIVESKQVEVAQAEAKKQAARADEAERKLDAALIDKGKIEHERDGLRREKAGLERKILLSGNTDEMRELHAKLLAAVSTFLADPKLGFQFIMDAARRVVKEEPEQAKEYRSWSSSSLHRPDGLIGGSIMDVAKVVRPLFVNPKKVRELYPFAKPFLIAFVHEHRAEFGKLGYLFESGSFDRYIGLLAARLHDCGIDEKGVHSEQDETIHKKCAADLKQVVAHYKREGMSGNELWVVAFLYRRYLDGGTDLVEIVQYYAREVLEEAAKEEPKKAD